MPKNKGGKNHRKGKSMGGGFRRELITKEDGQEYASVTKIFGNGHVECTCHDNIVRLGTIRGKMRNRVWISLGDVVLCGLRDFQDEKVDIIHKYNSDEIHQLQNLSEIPRSATTTIAADVKDISGQQDDGEEIDFSAI